MDFNQLKTFVTVVETGSFSRAGQKLFLSQPTVTIQIKTLEKELSKQLLVRSTNGIRMTEAGRQIFEYAKRALTERAILLEEFGQAVDGVKRINVVASSIPGQYVMPEIIGEFRRENPQVKINMLLCNSAQVCQRLLERQADIGLVGSDSFQGDCDYVPLADDPLVVITPNCSPYSDLSTTEPFPSKLLQTMPFVVREEGSGSRREFEKWLQQHGNTSEIHTAAIINDNQAIKTAVQTGAGIAVMSQRAVEVEQQYGKLLVFPLEGVAARSLYLVKRKKVRLMGEIADFYRYIKNFHSKKAQKRE